MLDGINSILNAFGSVWNSIFNAPLYGSLTWGYFLVSCSVIGILISFFISRLK